MSEMSPRRRLFGRTLFAAGAFALPLTASISYAVAQVPPAPPAPPIAAVDPNAPEAPQAPEAPEAHDGDQRHVRTIVIHRDGEDGEPIVRQFSWHGAPGAPGAAPTPPMPEFRFHGEDFDSEEFQRGMEQFQREMEQFRAEWTEEHSEEWAQWAEQHRGQALALADQARRMAPEVVHDCAEGDNPVRSTRTEDGRQRVIICNVQINRMARSSLRNARNAIAQNREISAEVRNEILEDLDEEIERIEREHD